MQNVMRWDCPQSSACVRSGFFTIEIDYSLQGSMSVSTLQISHPGRLNSTLAIFINLCLSMLDTEKKKLWITFRKCTLIEPKQQTSLCQGITIQCVCVWGVISNCKNVLYMLCYPWWALWIRYSFLSDKN